MATRAFLGKKTRPLGERIVAKEGNRASSGNSGRGIGEDAHALGILLGCMHGGLIVFASSVLDHGEDGQDRCATKKAEQQEDIEAMAYPGAAHERHEKEQEHDDRGDDDCAPDLSAAGKEFEKLKEEKEIPFGTGGGKIFGGMGWRPQF